MTTNCLAQAPELGRCGSVTGMTHGYRPPGAFKQRLGPAFAIETQIVTGRLKTTQGRQ